MKKSRFTETQIIGILKESDSGVPIKEICRTQGISDTTYDNWKSKYGGMSSSDLKRMCADAAMENRALRDLEVMDAINTMIDRYPRDSRF